MKELLPTLLSVSLSGSVIILLVLATRLLLRSAPRSTICLLWVMAGLRLLMPFQIESPISLQPELPTAIVYPSVTQPSQLAPVVPDNAVVPENLPPDVTVSYDNNAVTSPTIRRVDYGTIAITVWGLGAAALGLYTTISYWTLKRKLRSATQAEEGVYESDAIDSPFLLGYANPAIYLPTGITEADRRHILAHERSHLNRGDNWIKLVGFACVAVHWFNPLVWLGYHLLCKDIEMACDESVVRHMDLPSRKAYSSALVNCSTQRRFGACPVAFGEVSIKQRVLSVLNYRKPGFWISLACVLVIGVTVACFMTNPITSEYAGPSTEYLEKCEDAVRQIQSADAYYFLDSYECNDPDVLSDSSRHHYWSSGENLMQRTETADWENWYLYVNGRHYEKDVTIAVPPEDIPYPHWTMVNQPSREFLEAPWIMRFQWNDENISFVASQTQFDEEIITLSVREMELDNSYQLTFRFNAQTGAIRSIRRTVVYESVGTTYTSTVTYAYFSFDETEIDNMIRQNYLETQIQPISE
jgi:beta-lactamase regulating signal transducer with metallopeptidase domain